MIIKKDSFTIGNTVISIPLDLVEHFYINISTRFEGESGDGKNSLFWLFLLGPSSSRSF